jgi:hypothetical protein
MQFSKIYLLLFFMLGKHICQAQNGDSIISTTKQISAKYLSQIADKVYDIDKNSPNKH